MDIETIGAIASAVIAILGAIGYGFKYLLDYMKPLISVSVLLEEISAKISSIDRNVNEQAAQTKLVREEVSRQRDALRLLAIAVKSCPSGEKGCPAMKIMLGTTEEDE